MGRVRRFAGMGVLMAIAVGVLCFGLVLGDAGLDESAESVVRDKVGPLMKEIERLKGQVGSLESSLEKKVAHIDVVEKELKVLKEQGDGSEKKALSKLEAELESMSVKVKELEEQVVSASKQSDQAHRYAEALKKRAETAEESVRDLDGKYQKSHASFLSSKKLTKDLEKALKNAEATVSEAEKMLQAHGEELSRVHSQWLPPWAASQLAVIQSRARSKWSSHAKPHVDALYKHASDKASAAHAFVKPHFDTATSKIGPEAQKHWKTVSDSLSPHVQLIRTKTRQGYDVVTKDYLGKAHEFVQPHVNTLVETGRPYVSLIQEHTRPYVDQISTVSKPYLEHTRKFMTPHLESVSLYYRSAVSTAAKHHENLQDSVRENLSKHESVAPYVTEELVWFLVSGIVVVPVLTALFMFSSVLRKKPPPKRPTTSGSSAPGSKHKRAKKADK